MDGLTEEQKKRIETNRNLALQRRAAKLGEKASSNVGSGAGITTHPSLNNVIKPIAAVYSVNTASNQTSKTVNPFLAKHVPSNNDSLAQANRFSKGAKNGILFPVKTSVKGSCVLISRERFMVDIGYHKELIEIFKTIPSRIYDASTKKWNFALHDHDALIKAVYPLKPSVSIYGLPKEVLNALKQIDNHDEIDLSKLETTLIESLMEFQKKGVCFGIRRNGRVMIADDMGLGKTIQAIAIARYYKNEWPLLVVTPSSVRYSWLEAFQKWVPSLSADDISIINTGKEPLRLSQVYILSYDLVTKRVNELQTKRFQVVIADESHFLKSYKSARTKACTSIMKHAARVILLSGTPALSRPMELFTQIYLIDPKLFPDFQAFGIRYCDGKKNQWGWDFMGASHTQELLEILQKRIMIRRMKSEVMKELPAKQRHLLVLDPDSVKNNSLQMKHFASEMIKTSLSAVEKRGTLLSYFAETGRSKLKAVCDYILDLLESDCKFLCFAHHRIVIDGIHDILEKKKCNFICITGSTPPEMRKKLCDKFQCDDSCKVALLSITATNTGITLTAASMVVFAELFWNPGVLTQAEDRVHRIGQEDSVLIQYLVAKGTADDHLWNLVQHKLEVLNKVGLSKDNFHDANTNTSFMNYSQQTLEDYLNSMTEDEINATAEEIDGPTDVKRKRTEMAS